MKITVTAKNIKDGKRCDGRYCPVALAIKDVLRKLKLPVGVVVVNDNMALVLKHYWWCSKSVTNFVNSFDHTDRKIRPFSFTIPDIYFERN